MTQNYLDTLEVGDVVWWNGRMTSHEALIVDIDRDEGEVTIAGAVDEHGIEDGAAETYPLSQWAPDAADVNRVEKGWSDEKKRNRFGATEEELAQR